MNEEPLNPSMPHSVQAEKAILSVLTNHSEFWHELGDLTPEWYHIPQNRLLHAFMAKQAETLGEVEIIGLVQTLLDEGKLQAIGGASYVYEIATYQPSTTHFHNHLDILKHKYACRQAIKAATKIDETAYQSPEPEDLIEATNNAAQEIQEIITGSKPPIDTKTIAFEWYQNYQKLINGEKLPMGIQTGVWEIDQKLRGLQKGMMGIISARTSGGKSTLATQMMSNIASPENPCIYVFMEGSQEAALERCIIQISGLEAMAVTDPKCHAELNNRKQITEQESLAIAKALKKITGGGFHFLRPKNRKIQTICNSIRAAHRQQGIKVAFVDYVQIIHGEKAGSKEQEMMGISNALQELAVNLDIFICVLSQENGDGETKHARAIEEDSDWCLSIVQEQDKKSDNYKAHKHILITKDRHNGNAGTKLPLIFDKNHVKFKYGIYEEPKKKPTKTTTF
jgi:replicative DNA helicase